MISAKKLPGAFLLSLLLLLSSAGSLFAQNDADDAPDVTARTARISFLNGDVQIKRAESQDWERATVNLPIVEGDEIAAERNARLEIQFDSANYLRLSPNAYLKVTTLRDEGIALSLPNGMLSLRVLNFEKDRSYFEIDAPGTTISVERAGTYHVDAGSQNDSAVRVAVTDSGEARVYSENSGFTLKNGRSATVRLSGDDAGEWQTAAARFDDEFDEWAMERDTLIAKRLRDADFDKYYDRDVYGAEDLGEYGEWIYTKKYGYVWKPDRSATASYADWSPYRYGQWRWVPPYGWTWVNDEPWGYATYHHGRWVYENSDWYWSPYPQQRGRRSWWRPALVVISYIADNICWYPLPYNYGYYNYNIYYNNHRRPRRHTTIINNTTIVVVNPTPTPTPTPRHEAETLPQTGVITVAASDFGRNKFKFQTAPTNLAVKALAVNPSKSASPPVLPTFKESNGDVSKDILTTNPRTDRNSASVRTGATVRTSGVSTGETLRNERILGNRAPVEKLPRQENQPGDEPIRNTGAVKRQPRSEFPNNNQTNKGTSPNGEPIRQTGSDRRKEERDSPTPARARRERENQDAAKPSDAPTPRIERQDREEKSSRRERQPEPIRPTAPPREEPPPREERKPEPPRQEPRREEPVRQQPKQEPPPEKPAPPAEVENNKKDG